MRSYALALVISVWLAVGAAADTYDVITFVDGPHWKPDEPVCETQPGNGLCTLRAAVMMANEREGLDTIRIEGEASTSEVQSATRRASLGRPAVLLENVLAVGDITLATEGSQSTSRYQGPLCPTNGCMVDDPGVAVFLHLLCNNTASTQIIDFDGGA